MGVKTTTTSTSVCNLSSRTCKCPGNKKGEFCQYIAKGDAGMDTIFDLKLKDNQTMLIAAQEDKGNYSKDDGNFVLRYYYPCSDINDFNLIQFYFPVANKKQDVFSGDYLPRNPYDVILYDLKCSSSKKLNSISLGKKLRNLVIKNNFKEDKTIRMVISKHKTSNLSSNINKVVSRKVGMEIEKFEEYTLREKNYHEKDQRYKSIKNANNMTKIADLAINTIKKVENVTKKVKKDVKSVVDVSAQVMYYMICTTIILMLTVCATITCTACCIQLFCPNFTLMIREEDEVRTGDDGHISLTRKLMRKYLPKRKLGSNLGKFGDST